MNARGNPNLLLMDVGSATLGNVGDKSNPNENISYKKVGRFCDPLSDENFWNLIKSYLVILPLILTVTLLFAYNTSYYMYNMYLSNEPGY